VIRRPDFFPPKPTARFSHGNVSTRLWEGGNTQPMRVNQSAVYVLLVTGIQSQSNLGEYRLATPEPAAALSRDYLSP
jgi:hypothetical protein